MSMFFQDAGHSPVRLWGAVFGRGRIVGLVGGGPAGERPMCSSAKLFGSGCEVDGHVLFVGGADRWVCCGTRDALAVVERVVDFVEVLGDSLIGLQIRGLVHAVPLRRV
ncbi:hypothetical protein [Nocardia gipuzkoensis]|uniref:hypothetical protein n=1 Tax=Nocardia gipuzkoensis TaxID=2749991 RepID=UPI00237E8A4F|nr:hypothetical protein [Nocardia gipuzkoensis]MDE1675300.1 hypothetical protein [Nocardia gipuzkoensis]